MLCQADVEREARRIIADDYAGRSVTDDAIRWATLALEAGFNSSNVLMLAASNRPANWFETEWYFHAALAEVGVPWLGREAAFHAHACDLAAEVLSGAANPERSISRLAQYAIALDYPGDMMDLYTLKDQLDLLRYGLIQVDPATWKTEAHSTCQAFVDSACGA